MFDLNDEIISVVRQWVQKADNDLTAAAHTLRLRKNCPTDIVCFHAQQCVEKYVKALLVWRTIEFPRTHNLETLMALLPRSIAPLLTPEEQVRFTDYATVTRYPGDYDPIGLDEARWSVVVARRVRRHIRSLLPRETLP
jgi:HEPN domain-containing protein